MVFRVHDVHLSTEPFPCQHRALSELIEPIRDRSPSKALSGTFDGRRVCPVAGPPMPTEMLGHTTDAGGAGAPAQAALPQWVISQVRALRIQSVLNMVGCAWYEECLASSTGFFGRSSWPRC